MARKEIENMNIAIVGSRNFPDLGRVIALVKELHLGHTVISGGAIGVDQTAETAAKSRGMNVKLFLPDYDKYGGKYAPLRRNEKIVEAADMMYAFWHENSSGTGHVVNLARAKGIPVHVTRG